MAEIEEAWQKDHVGESDKAWDAIHHCLTDGSLGDETGELPLNHVKLGGKQLHSGDDYMVCLVTAEQAKDVAKALLPIPKETLRGSYSSIHPDDYEGEVSNDDFDTPGSGLKKSESSICEHQSIAAQ